MTYAFILGLVAAAIGLPYLWLEHRLDFWLWLALFAGKKAGVLVDEEEERRRSALVDEWLA